MEKYTAKQAKYAPDKNNLKRLLSCQKLCFFYIRYTKTPVFDALDGFLYAHDGVFGKCLANKWGTASAPLSRRQASAEIVSACRNSKPIAGSSANQALATFCPTGSVKKCKNCQNVYAQTRKDVYGV